MKGWKHIIAGITVSLTACSSTPTSTSRPEIPNSQTTQSSEYLADRVYYSQKDPRWARDRLGKTHETIETDGCLVSATAMALGNLGFETNPGDLNQRLTEVDGYTSNGWLIWSAIDKVTAGQATARYYDTVSNEIIDGCIADGYYPLARFILPNGRSHWSVILRRSEYGFHMRDPLHASEQPLIFPRGVDAFKAVRCVGRAG